MQRYTNDVTMVSGRSLVLALKEALPRALSAKLPISGPNAIAEYKAVMRPYEAIVAKWAESENRRTLLKRPRRYLSRSARRFVLR